VCLDNLYDCINFIFFAKKEKMRKHNEPIKEEPLNNTTKIILTILLAILLGICYFIYALLSIGKMGGP
jgi:hypothetical protein